MTRHNIAWELLNIFPLVQNVSWREKFKGVFAQIDIRGEKVYFLRPLTYMNLSGESVAPLCQFYKIERQEILVIQDELDLPFGSLSFKFDGGLAGHNGLKSIKAHMGGTDFARLRLGIGRPTRGSVSDWVLSRPRDDDAILFDDFLTLASEALESVFAKGIEQAANCYNRRSVKNGS